MSYINFNGSIILSNTSIVEAGNRGLRYGDGLFETIKYKNESLQLLSSHLDRLWYGLTLMQFELPVFFTRDFITDQILKLVKKNNQSHARVRLTVIRNNGGLYDAIDHKPVFIIESWALENSVGKLNENGLQLGIYKDAVKSNDLFSNLKHNNFLPYLMGALYAKNNRLNDVLLLNQHGRICDSTIANVFLIKDKIIYTPSLQEGCIAGTLRKLLIDNLPAAGLKIAEAPITIEKILNADELFLTNSITPVKWVAGIADVKYKNEFTLNIYNTMVKTFPGIFC